MFFNKVKKIIINIVLFLFVCVLLLLLGEWVAGIMVKKGIGQRQQVMGNVENLVMPSDNPDLQYVFRPCYVDADGDTITNAMGFHDYDWSQAQLDQSNVILNLGDSITFGAFIKGVDNVYGKVLESRLQKDFPDEDYLIFNAGIGGYNIWQEVAMMRQLAKTMTFKMVILGFCLNDSSPKMYVNNDIKGAVVNVAPKMKSIKDIFSRQFLDRSKLYVMFKESVKSLQRRYPTLFPASMMWHNVLVNGPAWDQLKTTLEALNQTLEKQGIPLVVVIFPYAHQLKLEAKDNLVQQDLIRFCREENIYCLDLFESFKENRDKIVWDAEGVHPDKTGHRVAGNAIYQYLIEKGLVP